MSLLKRSNVERLFCIVFFSLLSLKVLESFVLKSHGDGVSYHLVLGRYILEYGFGYAHHEFYLSSLTGLFDYLYTFPQVLFGSGVIAHLSSQFMHFACSILLAIFIFSKIFKDKLVFYSSSIFLLTFDRSPDFFIYAKNDGFLALVFLIGILILSDEWKQINFKTLKAHLVLGIVTGMLPLIKMSGLIYAVALFVFYLVKLRPNPKNLAVFILAGACTSLPVFIRNWIVIGNPFFPAFLELFPTKITSAMMSFMNSWLKSPASFSGVLRNFFIAFTPKLFALVALPLAYLNYKRQDRELNYLLILIFLFTTFYCFINPGYPAERFYFGCHFVLIYFIFKSFNLLILKKEIKSAYWILVLILLLIDSKVDKFVKRVFNFYPDAVSLGLNEDLLNKYAPYTKIWKYVKENSRLVTDAAPMVYYAPKGVRMFQAGHSVEANFLWTCNNGDLEKYKSFNYAVIRDPNWNECTREIVLNSRKLIATEGFTLYEVVSK